MVQQPCLLCKLRREPVPRAYERLNASEADLDLELREPAVRRRQQVLAGDKRLAGESPLDRVTDDDDEMEGPTPEELREIERERGCF